MTEKVEGFKIDLDMHKLVQQLKKKLVESWFLNFSLHENKNLFFLQTKKMKVNNIYIVIKKPK